MRARGGGVLSASALVAVGTSLLLAALVGVGVSALGAQDAGGASAGMRAEAASVVVPGSVDSHPVTHRHARRHVEPRTTSAQPTFGRTVATGASATPSVMIAGSRTSSSFVAPTATATASPSASSAHSPGKSNGNGNGKAKGSGSGHQKPAKR
ncbi:MAG TPA: hypothetical protein VFH66_03850 [Mycobacteriales bacterium]|nr:hypothetical protein [Mycobacteriales bacterium]